MRFGDVTNYGSYDQRQTNKFILQPAGDISKHSSIGYPNDGEIRYNTTIDRLEGHIRGDWSPFLLLDDFSECGGDTSDVIGKFIGACLNQCEYFSTIVHTGQLSESIQGWTRYGQPSPIKESHMVSTVYDLFKTVADEHGLSMNERVNFSIQPVMSITEFSSTTHQQYGLRGGVGWIEPVTRNRNSSDFGKFRVYHQLLAGYVKLKWTIAIFANRMDAFKIECIDGSPPAPPPPPPNPVVVDIKTNTISFDLYEEILDRYPLWNRVDPLTIVLNINSGVTVSGRSFETPAVIIDDFPPGTHVTINNRGNIIGFAGEGGQGGGYVMDPTKTSNRSLDENIEVDGKPGGIALYTRNTTKINNYSGALISGGGGGGGGSTYFTSFDGQIIPGTGGSGGAGGGVAGAGGSGWENVDSIAFVDDAPATAYDGKDGNYGLNTSPGSSVSTTLNWTIFDNQLTPTDWISPSISLVTGVGGAGGAPGSAGESGSTPALKAMGVVLWSSNNLPSDEDTLTIGDDTWTFYHCPTDQNTCWDGSTRGRNKDTQCKFNKCPDPPELISFVNKTDNTDSFTLEYEAGRHVDDDPVVALTDAEKALNTRQGFLSISWDEETDFSNINEKIVISIEGNDADMFELSATGENWSSTLDWPHNSFTKTHTSLFYIRAKPVGDIDDARTFYADLSVSAFGLRKNELIDCSVNVKVPSPVMESLDWSTEHEKLTTIDNFGYNVVHSSTGVTWDEANTAASADGTSLVNLDSQTKMNKFRDWYSSQPASEAWIGLDAGAPTAIWVNGNSLDASIKPTRWWTDDENGLTGKVSLLGDELNDYNDTHKLNYYITESMLPSLDFEWVDGDTEPTGKVSIKGRFFQNSGVTVQSDTVTIWSEDGSKGNSTNVTPQDDNTINASVTFSFDDVPASELSDTHDIVVSWEDPNHGTKTHTFNLIVHRVKGSIITIDVISAPHDYSYIYKNGPSDVKAFEIRGSFMYDNMDVDVGDNFEISLDQGTTWSDQHTITPSMNPQIVHARMKKGLLYTGDESFIEYDSVMTVQSIRAETKTTTLTGKVLECESKEITYTYDGNNMWYDVTFDDMLESGTIRFDMWGASGGSGGKNETAGVQGGRGGGGFYSEGSFDVQSGDTIRIQVGEGGHRGQSSSTDTARGGGGWSGRYRGGYGGSYRTNDVSGGGGGGGASLILKKPNNSDTWELIGDAAGGAGGGGAYNPLDNVVDRGADGTIDYQHSDYITDKLQGLNIDVSSAGFSYSSRSCFITVKYMNKVLYSCNTGRSYQMARLRRLANGEWVVMPNPTERNRYDVYRHSVDGERLNTDLNASVAAGEDGWLEMILISTNDEPSRNRGQFSDTLKTHFGASMIDSLEHRSAYILVSLNDGTRIHEGYKDQFNAGGVKWNSELTYKYGKSYNPTGKHGHPGCGGGGASSTIGGAAGWFPHTNRGASAGEPQLLTNETRDTNAFANAHVPYLLPPKHRPMNHAANYAWYATENLYSQPGLPGAEHFTRNGHPQENWTYVGTGPYGRQSVLWRCMNKDVSRPESGSGGSHGDGGWNKPIRNLDPNKHHMSIVYVRRPSSRTGGRFYHGCQWNNTMNMDGSINGNPYFSNFASGSFSHNVWYLSVGFIWAKNTTTSPAPGLGGVYRVDTGDKLRGSEDFRMIGADQWHRTYLYYSGTQDPGDELEWAHPGFFQIDEIPSLHDLLAGDYFGIQGSFPTQLTPQNSDGRHGQVKLYFDCCKSDSYCVNTARTSPDPLTEPTITLIGDQDMTFDQGGTDANFVDPGVTVTNGVLSGIRVHKRGDLAYPFISTDPNSLTGLDRGEYDIIYQALSPDGLQDIKSRILRIKDVTKPTIALIGDNVMSITTEDDFTDPGATANDVFDGDITSSITSTLVGPAGLPATVENMKNFIGDYTITYTVKDAAGNTASVDRTVTVTDTTKPVITLLGDNPLVIEAATQDTYTTPGATATDNTDGDISADITITDDIVFDVLGDYTATYTVSDSSGNQSSVTRTITIADTTKPVITLTGDDPYYHFAGEDFVEPGVAVEDPNYGTDLTDQVITSGVNTNIAGTYTAKYNVSDSSGNAADEKTRSVVVVPGMDITTQVNFIGYDSMSFQFSRQATGITSDTRSETYTINGVTISKDDPGGRHGLDYAHVGQTIYISSFDQLNDGKNQGTVWNQWGDGFPKYLRGLIANTHINTSWPGSSSVTWWLDHTTDVYYLRKDRWNEVSARGKTDGWTEVETYVDPSDGYTFSNYPVDPVRPWRVYRNRFDPGEYQLDDYSAMWFFNPDTPDITYRYELSTSDTVTGFDAGVVQTKTFNKFQTEVSFEDLQPYTFYACRLTVEHNNI